MLDVVFTAVLAIPDRKPQPGKPRSAPHRSYVGRVNHLVEMPTRTGARTAAAEIACNQSAELQEPASNCLVRNFDATLGQQILDITKR